jgi:putative membrane protein
MMGFGYFGVLLWIIFWVVIFWLFHRVFRSGQNGSGMDGMHHGYYGDQGKDPLDIARERYAKGEIDENEFNKIKKNLS